MDYAFLTDNYVWIIVIAVIVVMTIIGYIADKTKFGEKKEKNEKVKPVKEIEKNEEPTIEEPQMDDFMTEERQMDNFMMEQPDKQEVELGNASDNFEAPSESTDEVGFESFEPVAPLQEEVQEEPMNFEMPSEIEAVENKEITPENSEEVVSETLETTNVPVEENMNQENIFPEETVEEDFGLPSIDKLNQEIAEVEEDEDVWKF